LNVLHYAFAPSSFHRSPLGSLCCPPPCADVAQKVLFDSPKEQTSDEEEMKHWEKIYGTLFTGYIAALAPLGWVTTKDE
jgi:hypothetical protein